MSSWLHSKQFTDWALSPAPAPLFQSVSSVWSGSPCSQPYLCDEVLSGRCFPFCFCTSIMPSEFSKTQSAKLTQLSLDPISFQVIPMESLVLSARSLLDHLFGFLFGWGRTQRHLSTTSCILSLRCVPCVQKASTSPLSCTRSLRWLYLVNGLMLMVLGMIGEYIGRIYISINNAPQYVIKEIINKSKKGKE